MNEPTRMIKPSWWHHLKQRFLRKPEDRNELLDLLNNAKDRELIDQDALVMIEGVLTVSEMQVRDAMIPRMEMVVLNYHSTALQAMPIVIESRHSRFPVIGDSRDEIVGILLAKDLLRCVNNDKEFHQKITPLVRPAIFIPESKRLNMLLKEFRLNRNHMAIVVDEYGGISGLITIEDVLEQIVGAIEDEYDTFEKEPEIKALNENEYSIKATTTIEQFNEYFGTSISNEDFDTIGGYVTQQLGHVPEAEESIIIDHFRLTVILANKRRLQRLRLVRLKNPDTTL